MLDFFKSLSGGQVAALLGIAASLLQVGIVKGVILRIHTWENHHKEVINVFFSGVIPFLLTVGSSLVQNNGFTHAFPHFAETYLAAQAFYYAAVRSVTLIYKWYVASRPVTTLTETVL